MLGASWPLVDEFYLFGTAPWDAARPDDNIDVLFKNKIPMGFSRDKRARPAQPRYRAHGHVQAAEPEARRRLSAGVDARRYGKGRTFYTSLGHRDDIWSNDPVFRAHITGGIRWALGLEQ